MIDTLPKFLPCACLALAITLVMGCEASSDDEDETTTGTRANEAAVTGQPDEQGASQPPKTGSDAPAPGQPPIPTGGPAKGPEGPAADCFSGVLGDGKTCQADAALKLKAVRACAAKGYTLASLDTLQDCAGSTTAKYLCCK